MLRTRSPLSPGQALVLARLACIRRAASVRPEPGSNSPSRSRVPPRPTRRGCPSIGELPSTVTEPSRQLCAAADLSGRDDTELTCGLRSTDRDRTSAPSLAFGFHCSVFKKRLPDERAAAIEATRVLAVAGDTHSAMRPAANAPREERENVGVNRSRRSGPARGAIRRAGRVTRLQRARDVKQRQLRHAVRQAGLDVSGPTSACRPARTCRRLAGGRRRRSSVDDLAVDLAPRPASIAPARLPLRRRQARRRPARPTALRARGRDA